MNRKQLLKHLKEKHQVNLPIYRLEYLIATDRLSPIELDDYGNRNFGPVHVSEILYFQRGHLVDPATA
jgi:hypothetical protein